MKQIFILTFFLISLTTWASEPYTQLDSSRQGEIYLQTAIRQLLPSDSSQPEIYLVGAIHLGDSSYYAELQKNLDSYQRVLFECVTKIDFPHLSPHSTFEEIVAYNREKMITLATACASYQVSNNKPIESLDQLFIADSKLNKNQFKEKLLLLARTNHNGEKFILKEGEIIDPANTVEGVFYAPYTGVVNLKQSGLFEEFAELLELAKQGEHIMYSRPHFQWCDLSYEELLIAAKERKIDPEKFKQTLALLQGDSLLYYTIKLLLIPTQLLSERKNIFRTIFIQTLSKNNVKTTTDVDTLILDVRNEHVVNQIRKQSQSLKTIGVFYGAAHLQAIEDTLCKKDHYKPGKTIWIDAINASK